MEDGQLNPINDSPLTKGMLESNKCYVLDSGAEVFVWLGRITTLEERKRASVTAEVRTNDFLVFIVFSFSFIKLLGFLGI